jgi:4-aminobutyrate aminotransferase-like enzyme
MCGEAGAAVLSAPFGTRLGAPADVDAERVLIERKVEAEHLAPDVEAQVWRELDSLLELERRILEASARRVLGVFVEPMQEKTGQTLAPRFWAALQRLLETYDVPLVVSETASGLFRMGQGMWATERLPCRPDVVLWYAGGQLGHVFASDRYYLPKPLQLISTWDGDELSMRRMLWTLRALRVEPVRERAEAFRHMLELVWDQLEARCGLDGEGLYAGVDVGAGHVDGVLSELLARRVRAGRGVAGRVVLSPPLTIGDRELLRVQAALLGALRSIRGGGA